jgi:hypothetical protein
MWHFSPRGRAGVEEVAGLTDHLPRVSWGDETQVFICLFAIGERWCGRGKELCWRSSRDQIRRGRKEPTLFA